MRRTRSRAQGDLSLSDSAEGTGLEPVRACAQRFSRPPPYQLGLALPNSKAKVSTLRGRNQPVARVPEHRVREQQRAIRELRVLGPQRDRERLIQQIGRAS